MNLYRLVDGSPEALAPMEAEFAYPDWLFGFSHYDFLPDGRILGVGRSGGRDRLYVIEPGAGELQVLDRPWTDIDAVSVSGTRAIFIAAAPDEFLSIVLLDVGTGEHEVLRGSTAHDVDPADISVAEPIEFPTTEGTAFGLFYRPVNRRFE